MGFMLVQCGLGLWSLALLHLVAHSLYKAHTFLRAGSAVEAWKLHAMAPPQPPPTWPRYALWALVLAGLGLAGVALARRLLPASAESPSAPLLAALVALSLVTLAPMRWTGLRAVAGRLRDLVGVLLLYVGAHALAGWLMPAPPAPPNALAWALVGAGLLVLFAAKSVLQLAPAGRVARALHPWLFSGFYLDERFTRWTFRLWPPRLPPQPDLARSFPVSAPLEAGL